MKPVEVYSWGLCFLSACVSEEVDQPEYEAAVNVENPTGVTPWARHDGDFEDGTKNGSACKDHGGRKHVLFSC